MSIIRNNQTSFNLIEKEIKDIVDFSIKKSGIHYRIFSRIKDDDSIFEKIERKKYSSDSKKMQDLVGIRVTTYFYDDVELLFNHFAYSGNFELVDISKDELDEKTFMPTRKNIVLRFNTKASGFYQELKNSNPNSEISTIDNTFELQLRTVMSEGWHEVEHSLRYKCKEDWKDLNEESRLLNGIYASLEINDITLKSLFDNIAYKHYKSLNIDGLIRNKFRLKFNKKKLSAELIEIILKNNQLLKRLYRINRTRILNIYLQNNFRFQELSMNNFIYYLNYIDLKNSDIFKLTPSILKDEFHKNYSNI